MKNRIIKQIKQLLILFTVLFVVFFVIHIATLSKSYFILKIPTQSMLPTIKPMSIVIGKKEIDYSIGDIIAYEDANKKIIVHRIIDTKNEIIITKGDNNKQIDKMIYKNIILGKIYYIFSIKQIILFLCILCVFMFVLFMFVKREEA